MTPEPAELIKRTFASVHLLAYLKREELTESDREAHFDRASKDARTAQIKALDPNSIGSS